MHNDPPQEEALFEEALKCPSAEARAAFLDDACRGHPELRARLTLLLEGHFMARGFLGDASDAPQTAADDQAGAMIGRYKLLEKIGEGGFGVVYQAEQREPVKRRVALKIIKPGMDTKQVVARFEAERQALALMDHPGIARVFDGGATEAARPYFVMELVSGVPITKYCDEQQLSTEERLRLFVQVCDAVQHAHQKGIIHRDLKPSNILVTVINGRAVPKVIDFGVAKATQQELTEKTIFTQFQHFIGTPAYVSPEQAQLSSQDIDTRSDIYALGVLLYELLTGKTPFDGKQLLAAGLDEMRRIIREVEPVKPSTRLTRERPAACSGAFANSKIENRKSEIDKDLDWIVMKCLEKDRTRRYETANGLATDISRHLNNEPIVARPPSRLYRFQKTVQRNKLAFGAATAVALALVIGLAVSTAMYFKAQAEKKKSRTEAGKSQQVAQFLKDMLKGVGPSVAMGRDTTMLREVVDKTAERIGTDLKDQREVQIELRLTLADVYHELGAFREMEHMARGTLALAQSTLGDENLTVADTLVQLGDALHHKPDTQEAEVINREAITMQRKLRGPGSLQEAAALYHLGYALTSSDPSVVYAAETAFYHLAHPLDNHSRAKFAEAESAFRESLAIRRKILGNEHLEVARSLDGLSSALGLQNKLAEAEAAAREALAIRQKLLGNEHPELGRSVGVLGHMLILQGKYQEAEELYRQLLPGLQRTIGKHDPAMAAYYFGIAEFLRKDGKLTEARRFVEEAVAICLRNPDRVHLMWDEATFNGLRELLIDLGGSDALEKLELMRSTNAPPETNVAH